MGDSTEMTIEFLRARLLSERSVSRTARQRADQLAKRVVELEEQLRTVTIQRKKAEKAVAEVLAILEYQGMGDSSEVIDSSSDQDEVCDRSGGKEDFFNVEENPTLSRMDISEDRLSVSELDVSPSQGKSLSWKSHGNNLESHEKDNIKQMRGRQRRSSFMSSTVNSSHKHHLGKSCRKIKHGEMRLAVEDEAKLNDHRNGGAAFSNSYDDLLDDIPSDSSRNERKEAFAYTSVQCSIDGPSKESNLCDNGSDRDEDMEKVLEHQAQLIGQYQAEENAQREWEEKYNENKSSTMESSGRGSQPITAENSAEPKEEGIKFTTGENPHPEEAKIRREMLLKSEEQTAPTPSSASSMLTGEKLNGMNQERGGSSKEATALSSGIVPTNITTIQNESNNHLHSNGVLVNQFDMSVKGTESSSQGLAFSVKESLKNQEPFLYSSNTSDNNARVNPHVDMLCESPAIDLPSSFNSSGRLSKWRSSDVQSQIYRQIPQAPSNSLGGVLEALRRAKISLQQELNKSPLSQDTLAIAASTDHRIRDINYDNMLGIPNGSAGLFRLPTDSFAQANLSGGYGSAGLRLAAIRPHYEYEIGPSGYQYPTSSYTEAGPRVSVGKQYIDPSLTSEIIHPSSSMYSLPSSHTAPERTPSRGRVSGSYLEVRNEVPAGQRYFYGGQSTWPDMRRL